MFKIKFMVTYYQLYSAGILSFILVVTECKKSSWLLEQDYHFWSKNDA
jgi:hypothetical protein